MRTVGLPEVSAVRGFAMVVRSFSCCTRYPKYLLGLPAELVLLKPSALARDDIAANLSACVFLCA